MPFKYVRHKHSAYMFMPLNVFDLDGYDVESVIDFFRHKHSTWMVMPLNMFCINIQLR
jgi:hypothetical protein